MKMNKQEQLAIAKELVTYLPNIDSITEEHKAKLNELHISIYQTILNVDSASSVQHALNMLQAWLERQTSIEESELVVYSDVTANEPQPCKKCGKNKSK